jgi:hypothetical protein
VQSYLSEEFCVRHLFRKYSGRPAVDEDDVSSAGIVNVTHSNHESLGESRSPKQDFHWRENIPPHRTMEVEVILSPFRKGPLPPNFQSVRLAS